MDSFATVVVDASRFPARVRAAYLESFRARRMNHQFHYDTEKQAQLWLAIHEAFSPARTDDSCGEMYRRAFAETAGQIQFGALVSLGCGGGQKDLELLKSSGCRRYVPTDVSQALALTAHLAARALGVDSQPAVLDLAETDLRQFLRTLVSKGEKTLIAFFGMLPNFEPEEALQPLSQALDVGEHAIISANLAPGADYRAGVEQVLPQYDNAPTRAWLANVLQNVGIDLHPAELEFAIREVRGLWRIEVSYTFQCAQCVRLDGEVFHYAAGECFRLFFSYRHTPSTLRDWLARYDLQIVGQWITPSQEEGVFLCEKRAVQP